jgi:hypothetical protein
MKENASKAQVRAIEFHSPIGAALSLFSKASSLFARKEFPVTAHREFIRNYLILRLYSNIAFIPEGQKRRNSLFFSLLAGNSPGRDWFGRTTSTTRKSAQIDVFPPPQDDTTFP